MAQRDRIVESTRVFVGQELQSLGSSLNGNGYSHGPSASPGNLAYAPVSIAYIKSEHSFSRYHKEDSDNDDNEKDESRVRTE